VIRGWWKEKNTASAAPAEDSSFLNADDLWRSGSIPFAKRPPDRSKWSVCRGFVVCFDEVDAQLLDYSLKTHPSDLPFSGKYFLDVHSPAEHSVDALARHLSAVHLIAADSIEFSESAIAGHYGPKSILLFQDESIDEDSLLLLGRLNDLHRARSDALLIVSHNEQASRQLYLKLHKKRI